MAIVKINCFESDCGKTESKKSKYHHKDCASHWNFLTALVCYVLKADAEHTFLIVLIWLFNVILFECISSLLHYHKFELLISDLVLMTASTTILALSRRIIIEFKIFSTVVHSFDLNFLLVMWFRCGAHSVVICLQQWLLRDISFNVLVLDVLVLL